MEVRSRRQVTIAEGAGAGLSRRQASILPTRNQLGEVVALSAAGTTRAQLAKVAAGQRVTRGVVGDGTMPQSLKASSGRMSRIAGLAPVTRMAPKVYSPLFELTNLMLPRDIKTINAWARHFYDVHPIVHNSINLHSSYPISKFEVLCEEEEVKHYFEDMCTRLQMKYFLTDVSKEYWKLGEAFIYGDLDADKGTWKRLIIHNPDYIIVKGGPLIDEPQISLVPDDTLRKLVMSNRPEDVQALRQLDDELKYRIRRGEAIPLDSTQTSHLKRTSSAYDLRGTSLITCCFKSLMLWDKLREAKFAQADDMINPITLVKLGTEDGSWRPSDTDIQDFQQMIEEAAWDPDFKIVTHGSVNIEKIGNQGQIIDIAPDMDRLEKEILTGLFTPEAITHGEGPTYATASVGLEVLEARYMHFQGILKEWLEKKIFEPISKVQKFYKKVKGGQELIVPTIAFERVSLRSATDFLNIMVGMLTEHVSRDTVFRVLGLDPKEEFTKRRKQITQEVILVKEKEIMDGMSLEDLRILEKDPTMSIRGGLTPLGVLPGESVETALPGMKELPPEATAPLFGAGSPALSPTPTAPTPEVGASTAPAAVPAGAAGAPGTPSGPIGPAA